MRTYRCTVLMIVLVIFLLQTPPTFSQLGPVSILRSIIVTNLAGPRVVHETQRFEFDPDVADRRRIEFEARYGVKGKDLVEQLGLGEDGYMEQRRMQQRGRDREAGYFFQ